MVDGGALEGTDVGVQAGVGLGANEGLASSVVAWVIVVLWTFVWSICLLGLYTAWVRTRFLHRSTRFPVLASAPSSISTPGVTIIRPLRGLDPNLYYNLESTLCLDYPRDRFEVLFTVQREDDQAVEVVKMLLSKYQDVDARVVVSKEELGVNPKINNLSRPFSEAKYDILWVLDATVSVTPSMLARSVEALVSSPPSSETGPIIANSDAQDSLLNNQESVTNSGARTGGASVGLVHHLPFAWVPEKSFGSRLEQAYLNSTHAKMYLAINATGIDSCVVGKSNLYRRSDISRLQTPSPILAKLPNPPTGLAAFSPYLPEDNMIASAIWHQLKLSHRMTSDLALDCLGPIGVRGYIARRVRWIRVRRPMVLSATLLEPFTESLLLGALMSWAIQRLFGWNWILLFVLHQATWLAVDLSVVKAIRGEALAGEELREFVVAWSVREALTLPIWIWAMFGTSVIWRGVTYRIKSTGEAIKISEDRS